MKTPVTSDTDAAPPQPTHSGSSPAAQERPPGAAVLARLPLQRNLGNLALQRLLDGGGQAAARPRHRTSGAVVQRSPEDGAGGAAAGAAAAATPGSPVPATGVSATPTATPLVVEDGVADLEPGQMRKGDFLERLHAVVCPAAEEALAGTVWSAMGCPWIDHWLAYYGQRSAAQVEAAVRRYAGGEGAATAADYIPRVAGRVRVAIEQWAAGGEVTGLPDAAVAALEVPAAPGGEEPAVCEAPTSTSAVSGLFSRLGSLLMKRDRSRPAAAGADPEAVRSRLGSGRSLDGGVRRRMEGALGSSFSRVRLHAGAAGERMAGELGARAFTVGEHVAFGAGEYRPGTPVGDALIAHELAHVVQQGGGESRPAAKAEGPAATTALEEDADRSAVGAVMALWGGVRRKGGKIGRAALPRLRSGLQLQGCLAGCKSQEEKKEEEEKKVPWWQEEVKAGPAGGVFIRSPYNVAKLDHLLRQVDVLVEPGDPQVKKTPPREKKWHYFQHARVRTTQWTPKDVKKKIEAIFPPGGEVYIWSKGGAGIFGQIQAILDEYRKQHPNTFSILQGRDMAGDKTTKNCIEACNRAFSELYGPQAMPSDPKHFGTTVQDTIKKLKEQKLVAAGRTFKAEYTGGEGERFQIIEPAHLSKVKFGGAGNWVEEQARSVADDGVLAFAVNLSNGFHSASIVVHKDGSNVVMAWKDQHGTKILDAGGIDAKIKEYTRYRYRFWLRDGYNALYDPDVDSVDDITDDAKQKAAEERIKSSVLSDIAVNEIVRVKPL